MGDSIRNEVVARQCKQALVLVPFFHAFSVGYPFLPPPTGRGSPRVELWRARHPDWSRPRLSEELAQHWDWRTPAGQLKEIATRDVLNRLEARAWWFCRLGSGEEYVNAPGRWKHASPA